MSAEVTSSPVEDKTLDDGMELPSDDVTVEGDTSPVPSVGECLRVAREAKGLSQAEVAGRLKLSLRQVEALESDDWSSLHGNTIVRGFVRNYARLLGLDPAVLMAELDVIAKPQTVNLAIPENINVQVPDDRKVERRDYARVFAGLAVLILAVLAYLFLPKEFLQTTFSTLKERFGRSETAASKVVSADAESRQGATAMNLAPVVPASGEVSETSPHTPSSASALPTPVPSVAAEVTPSKPVSSDSSLKFSFSKPAWIEVKDKNGQILFSQLSPAGSQREVVGDPPYSLIIGNAGNVTLQYKGKAIDLSKRSKDDVARLTLE